ncbi:MAG TPA: hypothetical protein VIE88_01630, partial [Vicinamibacteria bacterium]
MTEFVTRLAIQGRRAYAPTVSMLPPFDKNGNLPVGVYQANEEEIAHRFVEASPRRKWLGEKLRELLLLAQSTHKLERVFIWGSFVTAEEAPG